MTSFIAISALLFLLVLSLCWRIGLFESDNSYLQGLNWYFALALFGVLWALPSFLLLLIWQLLS